MPAKLTLDEARLLPETPSVWVFRFLGVGPGTFAHLGAVAPHLGRESAWGSDRQSQTCILL